MSNFNEADWQNFLYLSILLIVLIVGNLYKPAMSRKKIIKYFVVWSALGLVIVSLYAYRYDFVGFKNKVLGGLNPSHPIIENSGKIILNMAQDGHFYIDLKVNSIPLRFMIDTGASDVAINAKDAVRMGIDINKLNFNKIYQTANGKSFGASVNLKEVAIGDMVFQNIPASVSNSDMGISLLGMSFLRQFERYEFYQDRLELTP